MANEDLIIVEDESKTITAMIRRARRPRVSLGTDARAGLVRRIIDDFTTAVSSNSTFRVRHVEMLKNWRGTIETKDFPFEGASNIRVPLTSFMIEQTKARLIKAILSGRRIANFYSLDESISPEDLEEVSDWFQYELEEVVGLERVFDSIFHNMLIDGIALPVPRYVVDHRVLVTQRVFELSDDFPLSTQLENAIASVEPKFRFLRTIGEGMYEIEVPGRGEKKETGKATFSIEDEQLILELERPEVTFDGVRVDVLNLEDVVVPNSAPSLEGIPFFGYRMWLSVPEFRRQRRNFDISDKDFDRIVASASQKIPELIPQDVTDESDKQEGTDSRDNAYWTGSNRGWIEVYRWEGEYEVGNRSYQLAAWLAARTCILLRYARLEDLNKDGKRSPVKFDFIKQPGRFYSIGLAEWLRHVQAELDGIHNQRLDAGLLANVPFGFYVPAAGMNKVELRLTPGKMYPIKDTKGVIFPKLNWSPIWSFNEEDRVRKYAHEQAGLGDPMVGSFPSKRLSASEFLGTTQAVDVRTEMIVRDTLRNLRELLYRILGLYEQFATSGRVFLTTGIGGEQVVRRFKRDRLHGRLQLRLTGNAQQISAQVEREIALNMLSLLMNGALIQLGIVKPDTIYAALEKLVAASGYRGVPLYKPDVPERSAPPETENKRMVAGEPVEPSIHENFALHLTVHGRLVSDPKIDEYVPVESQGLIRDHIAKTLQLQQVANILRTAQAQMAQQMQSSMAQMGIRPAQAGGSLPGQQTGPATQQEGTPTAGQESTNVPLS